MVNPEGCWLWQHQIDVDGYARIQLDGAQRYAHRWVWTLYRGPIPDGLELDHICRVHHCVNPDHLEPVTHQENILRGVSPTALNARKTRCVHGHELTNANLYRKKNGWACLACHREESTRYNQTRRQKKRKI